MSQMNSYFFSCQQKDKNFKFEMEPDIIIGEISNELHIALDCFHDERCVLYFEDLKLSNDQTLNHYGIDRGGKIEIKIVKKQQIDEQNKQYFDQLIQPKEIDLRIVVPQLNIHYQMRITNDKTIQNLTIYLQQILKITTDIKLSLDFLGLRLSHVDFTLEQLQIPNNSTIYASIELIGGF